MMAAETPVERRLIRSRTCKKRSALVQEDHETSPQLKRSKVITTIRNKDTSVRKQPLSNDYNCLSNAVNKKLASTNNSPMAGMSAALRSQHTSPIISRVISKVSRRSDMAESVTSTRQTRKRPTNGHVNGASATSHPLPSSEATTLEKRKQDGQRAIEENHSLGVTFTQSDMWTLKYAPSSFGSFVGNTAAVATVQGWLERWMNRRCKTTSVYYESCSSGESVQDGLSNAMFITGPPGVGKTALVYYIARILGYTVLEVNSSSERSGRRVLADLQEATQSLHVEGTNMSPSKGVGSFFRPVLGSTRVAGCAVTKQPKERNGPRAVRREKSVGGSTLSTNTRGTISSFFSSLKADKQNNGAIAEVLQISDQSSNEVTDCTANGTKGERRSSIKSFFKSAKKNANREPFEGNRARHASARTDACSQTLEKEAQKIKCSKSTIILFDDIDVIFDDDGDEGFWVALETMLRNSKKPCILTATRDYDSIIKRCRPLQNVPVVQLHRPSPTQVAALLKKIGKTENRDLSNYSVNFMCQYLASDVRRTLLQIEFETISPGLKQTIYPIDRSLGSLLTSGYNCVNQAISIQTAFKKSGFNAFYASLEQCLPFKFEDIVLRKPSSISPCTATFVPSSESRNHYEDDHKKIAMTRFHSDILNDLSEVFDKLAQFDVFTGCLDRMGEECLPNYERAKRWMEQRPFEFQDVNPRISEELLEIGSTVLIASVIRPLKKISERCAALDHSDQLELHLPRVASSLEFHNIHKKLKRVRTNERALEDVLSHFPVGRPLARDYLFFLTLVCEAEAERRGKPNGKRHNRFLHYLPQIGLSLGPEQIERIANLWV